MTVVTSDIETPEERLCMLNALSSIGPVVTGTREGDNVHRWTSLSSGGPVGRRPPGEILGEFFVTSPSGADSSPPSPALLPQVPSSVARSLY